MSTKLSLNSAKLGAKKKIDSPLAKYNSVGQLFCVLCNSQVKNEMYWTGHVNGKSHREALLALKNKTPNSSSGSNTVKRGAESSGRGDGLSEAKKARTEDGEGMMGPPKSIMLKPTSTSTSNLMTYKALEVEEEDEEERMDVENSSSSKSDLSRIEEALKDGEEDSPKVVQIPPEETPGAAALPAGFFDDAKEDAKARGIEYRNPEEAEWELFMKEIASEEVKSSVLRTVDEEESAKDRELDEIEEQMKNWQRYHLNISSD